MSSYKNDSNKPKVLVIEDEEDLRDIVVYNLMREGYQTHGVETGDEGLQHALVNLPDLIILDLMLPGMNGLDVCKKIKADEKGQHIPIIIVSAKGEEADIVTGLEIGADDYLTKPYSQRILLARIRALIRRAKSIDENQESNNIIDADGIYINADKFIVKINNVTLELTKSEFSILHFLAKNRGWVFTRFQVVDAIRGNNYIVTERAIDVQIAGLRKKLGDKANLIETVRGVGYRFKE